MRDLGAQLLLEMVDSLRSRLRCVSQRVEDLGTLHDDAAHHYILAEVLHRHADRSQWFEDRSLCFHHQGVYRGVDREHLVQQRLERS